MCDGLGLGLERGQRELVDVPHTQKCSLYSINCIEEVSHFILVKSILAIFMVTPHPPPITIIFVGKNNIPTSRFMNSNYQLMANNLKIHFDMSIG